MATDNINDYEDDEIDLSEVFGWIFDRIWLVILITVIGIGIGAGYLFIKTPIYQSTVSMYVTPLKASTSMDDLLSNSMFSSSGSSKINTEIELITSQQCLRNALGLLDLTKYTDKKGDDYTERKFTDESLEKMVEVESASDTTIVEITVTDPDKQFACDYANAIPVAYKAMMSNLMKTSKTSQRLALEAQIPENTERLEIARQELLDYSNKYGINEATEKLVLYTKTLATVELLEEPLELQLAECSKDLEDNGLLKSLDKITSDSEVNKVYSDYVATSKEYYIRENIEASIDDRSLVLSSKMTNLSTSLYESIQAVGYSAEESKLFRNYLTIQAKMSALYSIADSYREEIASLDEILSGEEELEAKVDMYQALILSLNQLLEETKMVEVSSESESTVIDIAKPAEEIYKPSKFKTMIIAAVAGFVIGVGLAFILGLVDQSVYSEEDVKKEIDDEIISIGWIPYIDNIKNDSNLVTSVSDSYGAERFRILCANIDLIAKDSKVLVFNSTDIGEGKSTVSLNVAATYATRGKKVIIVDCDLRRPQLDSLFGIIHQTKGITSYIEGLPLDECVVSPVSDIPSLFFLPAGHSSNNPNILFQSTKFEELINRLKSDYDLVILDCPPFSFGSDFMIISRLIDAYALVIRAGVATKDSVRKLGEMVKPIDAKLLGYVFNGVLDTSKHYGSYNYNYNYSYSTNSNAKISSAKHKKTAYKQIFKKEMELRNNPVVNQRKNVAAVNPSVATEKKDAMDYLSVLEQTSDGTDR